MFAMFGLLPTTLLALYIYSSIMYIKIPLRMQHNKYWQSIFDSYPVIPQINMRKCNITKALRKLQSLDKSSQFLLRVHNAQHSKSANWLISDEKNELYAVAEAIRWKMCITISAQLPQNP